MESLPGALIPTLFMLIGSGSLFRLAWPVNKRLGKQRRKSLFTGVFLHSSGYPVALQLEDARTDVMGFMMLGVLLPVLLIATALSQSFITGKSLTLD